MRKTRKCGTRWKRVFTMSELQPSGKFSLFQNDFYVDSNNDIVGNERLHNIESIRNIIISEGLTDNIYAITAIATATILASGINPRAVRSDLLAKYRPDGTVINYDSYGLMMNRGLTGWDNGYDEMVRIINDLKTGENYSPIDNNNTTISDILNSVYNPNYGAVFFKNYTFYDGYIIPSFFSDMTWYNNALNMYDYVYAYYDTHYPQINYTSLAILKKRKRKWYQ